MTIRLLALSVSALSMLTACPPKVEAECPIYEDLNRDEDVTISDLRTLSESWDTDDIQCEALCASIEYQNSGFETTIDTCALELDLSPHQDNPSAAEDSSVVGSIQCSGEAYTLCE